MPTIDEIRRDRDAAVRVIDALLIEAHRRLKRGDATMQTEKADLRRLRNQIEDDALNAILASPQLALALKVLAKVATDLGDVADNEQVAAEVVGKFAGVLGKAKTAITTAQDVLGG